MRYSILDPTGNITALVEESVAVERQPALAAQIMALHPQVEQVGFVRLGLREDAQGSETLVAGELRMAGGEFCGNATMSAAALCILRRQQRAGARLAAACTTSPEGIWEELLLRVSGAQQPVEVRLCEQATDSFAAAIHMPPALGIVERTLAFGEKSTALPVVMMQGISHVVIEPTSPFFDLRERPADAERVVRMWCKRLGTDGLGLMFLEAREGVCDLRPLVYVPTGDTVFWEHSCASGSAATGMYLAARAGAPVTCALDEPGGTLSVESDPTTGETWLHGAVCLVAEGDISW